MAWLCLLGTRRTTNGTAEKGPERNGISSPNVSSYHLFVNCLPFLGLRSREIKTFHLSFLLCSFPINAGLDQVLLFPCLVPGCTGWLLWCCSQQSLHGVKKTVQLLQLFLFLLLSSNRFLSPTTPGKKVSWHQGRRGRDEEMLKNKWRAREEEEKSHFPPSWR